MQNQHRNNFIPKQIIPCFPKKKAFTLIELLTVFAVIGILAAIIFPITGNIRQTASRAACASNLRQVGTALNLYLVDNDQMLPVSHVSLPANPTVRGPGQWQSLGGHLAPYLGINVESGTRVFIEVLECPGWPQKISPEEALASGATAYRTYRLVLGGLGNPNPFGGREQNNQGEETLPQRVSTMEQVFEREMNNLPIIFNRDLQLPWDHGGFAPERPVYGSGRNVLYLDGRVAFETGLDFLEGFR